MSGLEPLAAFGLACNVMQVIGFGRDVVTTCRAIYQTGSLDTSLTADADHLASALGELEMSLKLPCGPLNADEQALVDIAVEGQAAAKELKTEVHKISGNASKGKAVQAISGGFKTAFRKRRIEKLEKALMASQRALESRVLVRICTKYDATLICQQNQLSEVDATLRAFIEARSRGDIRLELLFKKESQSVKEHITVQASRLEENLGNAIQTNATASRDKLSVMMAEMELGQQIRAARETLLRSLKFETMNERRNSIADSDRDTSTWALDDGVGLPHHCFLDWLRSIDQKLFWINGKAGSGKSTLMKFLIRNPRTVEILSSANPRPIILSHFIWMAGQASERSLKGVYCSLLYQLLSADENLASLVLEKYPQLAQKDFHSDWEQLELDDGFFYAIGATLRPVCIFLDGLDEVDPADGQSRVLQLIGRFCAVGQVKVCVASRPEPVLRRQLCHCPMMRLQDLTKSDIRNHATNVLNPHITPQEKGFSEFLDRICEKADGVFLWVSLALKSLKSGIENGDSLEELQLRLDALPKDLQQLYSQMWRRLNDDEPIYRRDAALYFNLVLDFHLFEDKETITLFHILLASDAALAEQLIHDPETMSEKQFQQRCEGLSKRLEVRCAGVLEVTADVAQRVTFIHRSAREFLLNTPEGQQITQYDTSSSEARLFNLAAGDMALLRLRLGPAKFGIFEQFQYRRAVGYGLGYVTHDWNHVQGCVSRLQRLSHFKSVPATKTVELGRFCEEIYHTWRMGTTRLQKLDFLGIAALIGLVEFVRAAVVGLLGKSPDGHLSPPYESYLLRAAGFKIFDTNIHIIKGKEQLVTWLVSQGMISSLHLPAPFRERREVSAIGTLGTPATAILEDAVEYPYNTSVAILDHLAAIVRYNNSLEECVIISLFQFKDQFRISFDPDPNSREAGYFLLVQVNVAFLIDLYLKSMSRDCSASLGGRTLLQPTSQDAVRPESVLLGFSWFPEAEISSDGFNSGFNWDSNSSILLAPATKRDSDYALSAFAKAHLRDRDNYWIIPELEERLKIIEPRACITMARDMFEDLLSKGLMHRADNLENWPPKPF